MAGRWVAAMAAAAFSVSSVATALVVLRGALIRTGIGALIVGAGELVYQFSQLVARVGSVGEAFRLLGDLAREVWSRMGEVGEAFFLLMKSSWATLAESSFNALDDIVSAVVTFGDRTVAVFQGAYDAAVAIWGLLPGAIGDFAFQAANGLIAGVEAMLNGVVSRINNFIEALNAALALLPEWATGEGGVRIGTLAQVELGRIGNPFEGAAMAAGTAAADTFSAALSRTYLEPPDFGLGAAADEARERARRLGREAILRAADAARPLASWQALNDAVTGTGTEAEAALAAAARAAGALDEELDETGGAAGRAGGAGRQAGEDMAAGAEQALTGWQAVTAALADYAEKAREIGGEIGSALVGAFQSAENAIGDFVKKGKLDFRDLVTSMIADLAKLAARRFILGPIANALSGALGGAGRIFANVLHAGGVVGAPGPGRMVSALAFAGAPRLHSGGWAGLSPDEVPAILQRGERVLSRREALGGALGGAGRIFANVLHAGGVVGAPGPGRMVSALAFAGAPRPHSGGWAGLSPDEVPAILRRGERVLSRKEVARYGQNLRDLDTLMIVDLARLAARRFILGPIANALAGALGGAGGLFASVLHAGGMVRAPGPGRMIPALAFANAPRMHAGGWAGLSPDEVPAILQRGERVLSRKEAARYGQPDAQTVNITINARDAESFRQSRTQIAADIARAVALGRRGM
jgi:hypothetical protein